MRAILPAVLALCALAGGCKTEGMLLLDIDPSSVEMQGSYLGSRRGAKLVIEKLQLQPIRNGRGSVVIADLAILNERGRDIRFDCAKNRLHTSGEKFPPMETHVQLVKNGQILKTTLHFQTVIPFEELADGKLLLDGVDADQGQATSFSAEFSVPLE